MYSHTCNLTHLHYYAAGNLEVNATAVRPILLAFVGELEGGQQYAAAGPDGFNFSLRYVRSQILQYAAAGKFTTRTHAHTHAHTQTHTSLRRYTSILLRCHVTPPQREACAALTTTLLCGMDGAVDKIVLSPSPSRYCCLSVQVDRAASDTVRGSAGSIVQQVGMTLALSR